MNINMPTSLAGGRYQLGQLVGRGGMAEVHVATDTRLGRTVAVKIMRADFATDSIFLERFRREAHSVAQMNNPNIVNIYDSGEETVTTETGEIEHLPYLVMEYVKGQTLRDIIKVNGGSVNMYGQPGKTEITFTADGKSYDVAWALGSDKLNVKDVLPTGADYAWKAKVVGTDTALNNEDNARTLLDQDRYKTPTPNPEPSEPSEPSKPSEPSDSDASTEGEAATRNDRPVASSVALSTVDGASKPWIRGLAYYARW